MSSNGKLATPESKPNWRRGFWSLIATQFQGAFNENALKFLTIYLILAIEKDKTQRDQLEFLVGFLFAAPFIIFSLSGGYLADRFSKRSVTLWTKVFEIGVMLLAVLSLAGPNFPLALAAIFLVCAQGAIFGPSKYGLLPELLPAEKLSWGNGVIELWTLLAAITATLAGAFLAHNFRGRQEISGFIFIALSLLGLLTSLGISKVPAADPARHFKWNWPKEFFQEIQRMRQDAVLWVAVIANTFFWFLGAILLLNIVLYGTDVLQAEETRTSYLLAALSLGIGAGSYI